MKKLLSSKPAEYLAVAILIGVTAYLAFWCKITGALVIVGVFMVMEIIGKMTKKNIIHYAPLVTYLILVVESAVKFSLEDSLLRQEEGEILEKVVSYGSIMLLTIPILYYNRSLR